MIGTTGLRQLRIDCTVGIYPHEREHSQAVLLDIELDYDFASAAASDAIPDAVDYDDVAASVTALLQTRRFHLIETIQGFALKTAEADEVLKQLDALTGK